MALPSGRSAICKSRHHHCFVDKEPRIRSGRSYMAGQKYQKAYESYQQAVYCDGRNPTFWCSIRVGVLYYNINQFCDTLDAYSHAIRIHPYISRVWFDLGSLYESCNNQISDAIDAYTRSLGPAHVGCSTIALHRVHTIFLFPFTCVVRGIYLT
ncbi:hypothetical protein RSAG8_05958, partial [Rhizoctonia solani AG-8 WAC10335]